MQRCKIVANPCIYAMHVHNREGLAQDCTCTCTILARTIIVAPTIVCIVGIYLIHIILKE